jgi:hypothetical protein
MQTVTNLNVYADFTRKAEAQAMAAESNGIRAQ